MFWGRGYPKTKSVEAEPSKWGNKGLWEGLNSVTEGSAKTLNWHPISKKLWRLWADTENFPLKEECIFPYLLYCWVWLGPHICVLHHCVSEQQPYLHTSLWFVPLLYWPWFSMSSNSCFMFDIGAVECDGELTVKRVWHLVLEISHTLLAFSQGPRINQRTVF